MNSKYEVLTDNCVQVTMELFMQGTLPSGINVGQYIENKGYSIAAIPNWNMINMQSIFYNTATSLAGFDSAIQSQQSKYEGKGILAQWWYTKLKNDINAIK